MKKTSTKKLTNDSLPRPLQQIDLQRTLRQRGILRRFATYRKNYDTAKLIIKKNMPKKQEAAPRISKYFDNQTIANYAAERIKMVDVREQRFQDTVKQFLGHLEEKVLANIRSPKSFKKYAQKLDDGSTDLFDQEAEVSAGVDLFTPLIEDITRVAGSQAQKLINANGTYIITPEMKKTIAADVAKFTGSMLSTDQARLTNVLDEAFKNGSSVAEVRDQVTSVFGDIQKYQSERVARTELLRSANAGALDAYKQSEVVTGTQWVVDGDPCPECEALDGQTISLDDNWFDQGDSFMNLSFDYDSVDSPPLHPNCECTIVPILS